MNDDNKKFTENLKKLLIQSSKENKLFTAGNYWEFYEKNIFRQVKNNDISKFDLFVNVASFQEMEKEQVYNYLSILEKHLRKYVFLCYVVKEKKSYH